MDQRRDPWWALVSLGSALVVLGPLLGRGDLLWRDAVFAPGAVWSPRLLGLTQETPRAVPSDLLVVTLSHLVPAHLAGILMLGAILTAAGWGTARLLGSGLLAGVAAAVAAVWNPYVAERLGAGQWPILLGYAAVPWVVAGVVGWLRDGRHRRVVILPVALGALGGASALLVVTVALVGALAGVLATGRSREGRRRTLGVVALGILIPALVWAVPSLLRSSTASDPAGFRAFAPRPDLPIGLAASVLTGGGIWNADAVPVGRDGVAGAALALLVLAVAAVGLALRMRRPDRADVAPVVGAGVAGLAVVTLTMVPAVADALAGLPGGGLLRDAVRQLGPWVVLLAVGVGHAVDAIPRQGAWAPARWGGAILPAACLSGMAWGLGGQLGTAHYPAAATEVVTALNASTAEGSVVVLPYAAYRRYAWNDDRSSLTPWSRMVTRPVVASADLVVSTPQERIVVRGEDDRSAQVATALVQPDPAAALGALGVRWVIVDDAAGTPPSGFVRVTPPAAVSLWRLAAEPGVAAASRSPVPVAAVVAADAMALLGLVWLIAPWRRAGGPRRMATMR